MRILFFGLNRIGCEALAALTRRRAEVAAVVTRTWDPAQVPLMELAGDRGIPIVEAVAPGGRRFLDRIRELSPEVIATAGGRAMLPDALLAIPRRGGINVHLSLLPAFRGLFPWKWAVARGERRTGVTIHRLTSRVNAGEMLAREEVPIDDADTGETLYERLSRKGGALLAETLDRMKAGPLEGLVQDERQATYFAAPTARDVWIDWSRTAERIRNQIRAFWPRPGAWTLFDGTRVEISRVTLAGPGSSAAPGAILRVTSGSLVVATGSGLLEVHHMLPVPDGLRVGARFAAPEGVENESGRLVQTRAG